METVLLATALCLLSLYLVRKYFGREGKGKTLPGPRGFPLIGSVLQINPSRMHEQFYDYAKRYGDIFKIQLLDSNIVVLNSADMFIKAYNKAGGTFNHRPKIFIKDRIGVAESIAYRDFDKEHRHSKKTFTKTANTYGSGDAFESVVQQTLSRLTEEINRFNGMEFELIREEATEELVELFSDISIGDDFFLGAETNTLLNNFHFLIHLPYFKRRLEKTLNAKRQLQDYFVNSVKNTSGKPKEGFVKGLFDSQQSEGDVPLTDEQITSIIITDVLSGGTITTTAALPNAILCLVNHPEYQKKLQDELDAVIGMDRKPAIADRNACSFTEAVLLESMRYISFPFGVPHTCKEDSELDGYLIKANTAIMVNNWYIHHDESVWGDPWNFRPERFLDDDGKLLPNSHVARKSFMMFGTGGRMCPGMSIAMTKMFLYLATLFQKYTFKPCPGKCGTCDPRTGEFIFDLIAKPKPFYCMVEERKSVDKE